MSERGHDSDSYKFSVTEILNHVLNLIGTTCSNIFLKLVGGTLEIARKGSSISTTSKTTNITSIKIPYLRPAQTLKFSNEITKLLSLLIIKQFSLTKSNSKKLHDQLCVHFNATSITNKSCVGMMTKHGSWEMSDSFSTEKQDMDQLTIPITLLLYKLAIYTVILRKRLYTFLPAYCSQNLPRGIISTKKEWKKKPKLSSTPVKGEKS